MTLSELKPGQFAEVLSESGRGMAVLAVSERSFTPVRVGDAHVVHLANGIGSFPQSYRCKLITMADAFKIAAKY